MIIPNFEAMSYARTKKNRLSNFFVQQQRKEKKKYKNVSLPGAVQQQ